MNAKRIAAVALLVALATAAALRLAPLPAPLREDPPQSTEFVDREGIPLRTILVDESAYRRRATLAEISPHAVAATLAAEDARFFHHPGVDPLAIARATANRLRGATPTSGASTITQQLVKQPGERTVWKKVGEAFAALSVETAWSKEKILEEYLNRVDYGNLQIGIGSASRYYFGKPPSDLSPAEAAFLAALPRAPSRLDPHRNWQGARARQQWVLQRMHATGALGNEDFSRAVEEPITLRSPQQEFAAPHFVDLLLRRRGTLAAMGGRVKTTLDLPLTHLVEQALSEQLVRMRGHEARGAAAVVLNNPTGEVLALAGSGDYFAAGAGQINGAWVARSPGSAVKPFTYLLALERGSTPATVVPDVPSTFDTPTGPYRPNNYNHRFYGPASLRFALGNSLNVAAIRTLELAGGPGALYRLLRELGLSTLGDGPDHYGPGLTLGNGEVRLLELANAYATIARGGRHLPFRLLDAESPGPADGKRLFAETSAYLVSDMLADNRARASSFGLNSQLFFAFPVACKTGTSSDYRDNWAVGYTPEFTVVVWVGNPNGKPMHAITGVTGAAPAMHEIMQYLHESRGTTWFVRPPGISESLVQPLTGHAVPAGRPGAVREIFATPPPPEAPGDYTADGKVHLPGIYREWFTGPQNALGDLATCGNDDKELMVVNPAPGSVFFLDPDLPAEAQRVPLVARGPAEVHWASETLDCADGARPSAALREGTHAITAQSGGKSSSTWIVVRRL